eukprot:7326963-Lingulodinium_polyedra.AAC.1
MSSFSYGTLQKRFSMHNTRSAADQRNPHVVVEMLRVPIVQRALHRCGLLVTAKEVAHAQTERCSDSPDANGMGVCASAGAGYEERSQGPWQGQRGLPGCVHSRLH